MHVDVLLLGGRLLLGGVFLVAALAKLVDRPGSLQSLKAFGVPDGIARWATWLLPAFEFAIAMGLQFQATAVLAASAAASLLIVFVAAIAHNLARGRQPDCHCFGQLHSEPVGWPVLGRNAVLAATAVFIAAAGWDDPGPGTLAWLATLTAFEGVALFGGLAIFAALVAQSRTLRALSQQQRIVLDRLDALDSGQVRNQGPAGSRSAGKSIGSRAPDFALPDVDGRLVTLESLRAAGRPVVLVFSDPNCGPCDALLPQIAEWQRAQAHAFTLAVVSRGTVEANRPKADEHDVRRILIQDDREVADEYGVWGTPSAVMIRADGTIGSMLSQAEAQIIELMDSLIAIAPGRSSPPPPLTIPRAEPPAADLAAPPPVAPLPAAPGEGLTVQTIGGTMPVPITNVPLDMKLKQESCVQTEELPDGGAVLYNGCNRHVLTLNATAALVWECCDSDHAVRDIVAELADVFPAAAGAERDVRQVVQMLADAGMVSRVDAVGAPTPASAGS